jgi:hypothetical protein
MRTISSEMCRMIPGRPTLRRSAKFHFCVTKRRCQPQQGVRRDFGVEFEQCLSPYSLGLACQESPLSIDEADSPSAEPVLEQSVLSPEEFDDDQLMPMNPASGDHQKKR